MVYYAVMGCSSTNNMKTQNFSSNCQYFSFLTNTKLCNLRLQKCYQKHAFNIKNARICSEHFSDNDFCDKEKLLQVSKE